MRLSCQSQGTGPVVVLLHGFPLEHTLWTGQIQRLSEGYRVVTPDLRGHGDSAAPAGIYRMEDLASDVIETLDAEGIHEPVFLGGMSMGGYVAMALAAIAPQRLAGLMLLNTKATPDTPEAAANRESLASQVEMTGDVSVVVRGMIPRLFSPRTTQRDPELVSTWADRMNRTSVSGVVGSLRGMALRPDRTPLLQGLSIPMLVVAGADDQIVALEEARQMAACQSSSELVVIPDVGHMAPVENVSATNDALIGFLQRNV